MIRSSSRSRPTNAWSGRRALGAAPRGDVQVSRGSCVEDRALELPQLRAWLDAELVHQPAARLAVDVERLLLAARAVESEHQLRPQPLAIAVLIRQQLELADHVRMTTEREVGVDAAPPGSGDAAPRAAPPPLGRTPRTSRRRAQARATARAHGAGTSRRAPDPPPPGPAPLADQLLEAPDVELPLMHAEDVAGTRRLQDVLAERLAQPRDVHLDGLARGRRRRPRPQVLDEAVAETTSFARRSSRLSSSLFLRPPSVTGSPSRLTSNGPRIRYSIRSSSEDRNSANPLSLEALDRATTWSAVATQKPASNRLRRTCGSSTHPRPDSPSAGRPGQEAAVFTVRRFQHLRQCPTRVRRRRRERRPLALRRGDPHRRRARWSSLAGRPADRDRDRRPGMPATALLVVADSGAPSSGALIREGPNP